MHDERSSIPSRISESKAMRPAPALILAATTLLAACETPRPFLDTELGRRRTELIVAAMSGPLIPGQDLSDIRDVSAEAAAFQMVEGLGAAEAAAVFAADGATCTGRVCEWRYTVREALFPCNVPLLGSMCVRMPGPRSTFDQRYRITILGDPVRTREDLAFEEKVSSVGEGR